MKIHLRRLGIAVSLFLAVVARAVDGTWNVDANGSWTNSALWLGNAIADGQDRTATFGPVITGSHNVTNSVARTIGNIIFSSGVPANSYTIVSNGGNFAITLSTSTGTPTISTAAGENHLINVGLAGTQGFVKTGDGGLRLGGLMTNTITGGIIVSNGTLRADKSPARAFNGQTITIMSGAQAYHNAAGTNFGNYNIAGDGVFEGDNVTRLGAIRFATANVNLAGTITLQGDAGISARNATTVGATISGKITGPFKIRFGRTSTTQGGTGSGMLTISNPNNDWTGDTTFEEGTNRLGAAGVIPNGASAGNVIMKNDGPAHTNNTADTILDLNGNAETINGLASDGSSDVNKLKISTSTGSATLTVGDNNATATYAGILQNGAGTLSFAKTGTGTETLSGANTYSGSTTISGGALALSGTGSIANTPNIIVAGGATFDVSGLSSAFSLGGSQTLSNTTAFAVLNGNAGTGSGTVSLNYDGVNPSFTSTNGTLTLSSSTVLKVKNTLSPLSVGSYKLIAKATSGNTGAVAGTAPSSVTVTGGGIAGGTVATLQITSGELFLVVSSSAPARINNIGVSGTTLSLSATNGVANGLWTLLQSTNVALPFSQWQTNRTGTYDGSGNLSTNIVNGVTNPEMYYLLK